MVKSKLWGQAQRYYYPVVKVRGTGLGGPYVGLVEVSTFPFGQSILGNEVTQL